MSNLSCCEVVSDFRVRKSTRGYVMALFCKAVKSSNKSFGKPCTGQLKDDITLVQDATKRPPDYANITREGSTRVDKG